MAWTATPKSVEKDDEGTGVRVTVIVTDGTYTETLVRPMRNPKDAAELDATCKNWIAEVKERKTAIDKVDEVLPEMKKKIDKPVPEIVREDKDLQG